MKQGNMRGAHEQTGSAGEAIKSAATSTNVPYPHASNREATCNGVRTVQEWWCI